MPEIIRIDMENSLYQKERELRNNVLLRPIGIPDFGWEMNDPISWHFVAMDKSALIGCVLLVPMDTEISKGQLIQMAVNNDWQGKGIGKLLVRSLIDFAISIGIKEIEIHSRAEVTSFYEQLGFKVFGDEFEEVGIKHRLLHLKI